jgi:hypothetical protein
MLSSSVVSISTIRIDVARYFSTDYDLILSVISLFLSRH